MVQENGRITLHRRDLPAIQEQTVYLGTRVPESQKRSLLSLSQATGYRVSDLVRLAIGHFLATVEIEREDDKHE